MPAQRLVPGGAGVPLASTVADRQGGHGSATETFRVRLYYILSFPLIPATHGAHMDIFVDSIRLSARS